MEIYGLFRQNLNRTETGNLTNTNGFLDIMLSFHIATSRTGNGAGNLGNGFPTHSATYLVTLQGNLWCLVQSLCT